MVASSLWEQVTPIPKTVSSQLFIQSSPSSEKLDSKFGHGRMTSKKTYSNKFMKDNNPLEKVIEAKIVEFAKAHRILCYKFTSPARRSVPDRLLVMPNGKGVFFLEVKRLGQKPTAPQAIEIDKIRAQGTYVGVVDSVEEGKRVILERLGV